MYDHVGLVINDGVVFAENPVVPDETVGRTSSFNVHGREIIRKDLPRITKTFIWDSPNFGDAATYGTHTHYRDREVYQRQIFEARFLSIKTEIMSDAQLDTVLAKFSIEQIFDKASPVFEDDIFFAMNLLQENTGVADVYASDASREDFIGTVYLDWEVFPPGNAAQLIASMSKGSHGLPPEKQSVISSRLRMFQKYPVKQLLKGTNNFSSYIGALYADDLVVFENVNYGNALYVLFDDWQEVSKRSRLDLLKGTDENFERIVHTEGWGIRFEDTMNRELAARGGTKPKRRAKRR